MYIFGIPNLSITLSTTMPPPKYPTRAQQPSTSGLGKQFKSPIKRGNKSKTTQYVQYFGRTEQIASLQAKIDLLKRQAEMRAAGIVDPLTPLPRNDDTPATPAPELLPVDEPTILDDHMLPGPDCIDITQDDEHKSRRIVPNQAAKDLYSNWTNLLARLVTPAMEYTSKSIGNIPERVFSLRAKCRAGCQAKINEVLCLFQDCKLTLFIVS